MCNADQSHCCEEVCVVEYRRTEYVHAHAKCVDALPARAHHGEHFTARGGATDAIEERKTRRKGVADDDDAQVSKFKARSSSFTPSSTSINP